MTPRDLRDAAGKVYRINTFVPKPKYLVELLNLLSEECSFTYLFPLGF